MADEIDDESDGLGVPHITVQYLRRDAPDLPDDYTDMADQELCETIAQSFAAHIEGFSQSVGQTATVEVSLKAPPSVTVRRPDGRSVEVSVYGNEAFILKFSPIGDELLPGQDILQLFELWPELDSSGVAFLTHMFVETGSLDVPIVESDGEAQKLTGVSPEGSVG